MSCALILGSALGRPIAQGKKVGIIMHQKASHLDSALLNNALGIAPGTSGKDILQMGQTHLGSLYPQVEQIHKEKVLEVIIEPQGFFILTNKSAYRTRVAVIAVGYTHLFQIKGLEAYVMPHSKTKSSKNRVMLKNEDHLIVPGLYVAGTLAGWRSQFSIACGSGASVATDILSSWNQGEHTKVHDKLL